jgi:hypothetical protein
VSSRKLPLEQTRSRRPLDATGTARAGGGRTVHLVVTCTKRKRRAVLPELTIGAAVRAPGSEPWKAWRRRLEQVATETLPAQDLYVGGHFHLAKLLLADRALPSDVSLWICSAGYGLVGPKAALKPYSAVFTPGSRDSVARLLPQTEHGEAVARWWNGLAEWSGPTPQGPRRIVDLARLHADSTIIVALSPAYLAACQDDVVQAAMALTDPERLLIVSPGSRPGEAAQIRPLPLDGRAAAVLGGTMGTLGIRFVRYLLTTHDWDSLRASTLRPGLERWLSCLKPRFVPVRRRHDDPEVAAFIRSRLSHTPNRSATQLLREYRHLGQACEQKRFHTIYSAVKEEGNGR